MVGLKNITNFKWSNITQYLIFEGLVGIGQVTFLTNAEVPSLAEPPDVVWLWM